MYISSTFSCFGWLIWLHLSLYHLFDPDIDMPDRLFTAITNHIIEQNVELPSDQYGVVIDILSTVAY